MASQQQTDRPNNDRPALNRRPLDIVMSDYTHYELNENLEIEKWYRPAAPPAPAPEVLLLPTSPEERQDRSLELRARWEEQPEVSKDKVPDQLAEAECKSTQMPPTSSSNITGYEEPSEMDWPVKLPSRAQLTRMAYRRPRPRPNSVAAKARERGGAARPEPVFWGNGQRRVTLGKDYKASRMIKYILDGARAKAGARASGGNRRLRMAAKNKMP
ncbi:hypothetical protein PpBr36_03329 [Pyricularia pennisetigena]|uniref:hypothetical protein n=1 Tax=Pyricularia pennisetigena TaxID=1578925 RepID=UPI00114F880C|nr:hypothetical protein PpBr36_03329 [Pyricularia pennisetigena]TLS30869.1 hypothetical protein PpBr36_03329 [Pyricularia pennisetigena]